MPRTFTIMSAALATTIAAAAMAQDAKPQPAKPDAKPQAKTLTIGDAAPPIDIEHWIKGDKVAKFESGKVYVVEFWATWCGPCKVSMPHLGELQTQYKDYGVTFIGISDEPLDTVTKFLDTVDKKSEKKWSDLIQYTLTTDPDKSVRNDYFTAAGQRGIPSAFIVGKDQHVEWIGNPHPMSDDGFDKALEAVVKDTWDRTAAKTAFENRGAAEKAAADSQKALATAMQSKDWPKVIEIADTLLAKNPKDVNAAMLKFRTLVNETDKAQDGYAFLKEYVHTNHWDNAEILNMFAWTIVDDASMKTRDQDVAMGYAMRAAQLSEYKNPAVLDTLARCWHDRGNLPEAIKWQTEAAKFAGDDPMGEEIKATLKKYEEELAKKGG